MDVTLVSKLRLSWDRGAILREGRDRATSNSKASRAWRRRFLGFDRLSPRYSSSSSSATKFLASFSDWKVRSTNTVSRLSSSSNTP